MRFIPLLTIALVAAAGPAPALAQEPRPESRVIRGQLGASINNAGLQHALEVAWIRAQVAAGVVHGLTPAQTRLGGWVQYSPFRVLDIRAGVEPSVYFGTFNSLQGFDSYGDAFDKDARDLRAGAKPGLSVRSYIAPTIKMKAGPIAAASTIEMEWWRSSADGSFFYEPTRDTLLNSSRDRLLNTTSVLLYQRAMRSGTLSAGALHTYMKVLDADENLVQKAGVIAIRELQGRRFGLPNPRLTLVVARYLDDPNKEGQWTAAMAIGFRAVR